MLHTPKLAAQKLAKEKGGYKGGSGVRDCQFVCFEELLGMDDVGGVGREARCGRVEQMGR